jgi:hypothetical protein
MNTVFRNVPLRKIKCKHINSLSGMVIKAWSTSLYLYEREKNYEGLTTSEEVQE